MIQIYPDQGLVKLLQLVASVDLEFHIYKNDVDPDRDTVLADLTEQDGAGYAAVTVAAADWTLNGVAGHQGSLLAAPIAFTAAAGGAWTSYGYYVTTVGGTVLLWVARFDDAPIATADTESILVTPVIGDFSREPL